MQEYNVQDLVDLESILFTLTLDRVQLLHRECPADVFNKGGGVGQDFLLVDYD